MKGLLKFKEFSALLENLNRLPEIINESGAYGHIEHPFEDIELTFLDLEDMLLTTVNGAFGPENFLQTKCLFPDSLIQLKENGTKTIKEVVDNKISDMVLSFDEVTYQVEYSEILNWVKNENSSEWLEIELEDGNIIKVTPNHRMFVHGKGDVLAQNLKLDDQLITV